MRRRGHSLLELLIALTVSLVLVLAVFQLFMTLTDGFRRTEREVGLVSAFRAFTARLERDLTSISAKAVTVPGKAPKFKPLDDGFLRIQWPGREDHLAQYNDSRYRDGRCRYLGFYVSPDGVHMDRMEYWFNPPEALNLRYNGVDDDGDDDPDEKQNPAHGCRDDRGRISLRRTPDAALSFKQYHNWPPDGADQTETATVAAYRAPRLTGGSGSEYDRGEPLVEGFEDIYFEFLYWDDRVEKGGGFRVANRWPCGDSTARDETGFIWPGALADPNGDAVRKGLSYLALPSAVRVTAVYASGTSERKLMHTIPISTSTWLALSGKHAGRTDFLHL